MLSFDGCVCSGALRISTAAFNCCCTVSKVLVVSRDAIKRIVRLSAVLTCRRQRRVTCLPGLAGPTRRPFDTAGHRYEHGYKTLL